MCAAMINRLKGSGYMWTEKDSWVKKYAVFNVEGWTSKGSSIYDPHQGGGG